LMSSNIDLYIWKKENHTRLQTITFATVKFN
jgi:hypothetical protein